MIKTFSVYEIISNDELLIRVQRGKQGVTWNWHDDEWDWARK